MEEDKPIQDIQELLQCPTSPHIIDTAPAEASVMVKKRPSSWGNIRHVPPERELYEREADEALVDTFPLGREPDADETGGATVRGVLRRKESFKDLEAGLNDASEVLGRVDIETTTEMPVAPQSEEFAEAEAANNGDTEDGLVEKKLDPAAVRAIALRALAAVLGGDEPTKPPSTPLQHHEFVFTSESTSPSPMSSSHSQARSPLRSPCWRTLITVSPPSGGYWTPSSTERGQKNTPMCPPCRSGKKGRCFGGLPCDRCKEKKYSKERCEGRMMFRFSPRKRAATVGRDEMDVGCEEWKRGSSESGRGRTWKRDAFGRFA